LSRANRYTCTKIKIVAKDEQIFKQIDTSTNTKPKPQDHKRDAFASLKRATRKRVS
jgi:hypothetical protein